MTILGKYYYSEENNISCEKLFCIIYICKKKQPHFEIYFISYFMKKEKKNHGDSYNKTLCFYFNFN